MIHRVAVSRVVRLRSTSSPRRIERLVNAVVHALCDEVQGKLGAFTLESHAVAHVGSNEGLYFLVSVVGSTPREKRRKGAVPFYVPGAN